MSVTISEPGSEPSFPTFRHGLQITGTKVLSDSPVFCKKQHLPLVMRHLSLESALGTGLTQILLWNEPEPMEPARNGRGLTLAQPLLRGLSLPLHA